MVKQKMFITIKRLFFVLVNNKIVTLTCYRSYLQQFRLNDGIQKHIYEN